MCCPANTFIFYFIFQVSLCAASREQEKQKMFSKLRLTGLLKMSPWIKEATGARPCIGVLGRRAEVGHWHPATARTQREGRARGKDAPIPDTRSLKTLETFSPGVLPRSVQCTCLGTHGFLIPREGYGTSSINMNIFILREWMGVSCK